MSYFVIPRARLLLTCLCLMTGGCMGPNPLTVDPHADCRSMGLTPGSTRYNECVLVSKDLQLGGKEAPTQKSIAEIDAMNAQRLQPRSCDPTTGLCSSNLLRQ